VSGTADHGTRAAVGGAEAAIVAPDGADGRVKTAGVAAPIVEVRGASFAYDPERPVLRQLSFAVTPGEFVGVVGPNGSGKSTLLDLVDGVLAPTAGAVLIGGRATSAYRRRELAREVALVPQHFMLEFDLTVRELVEMGAYCRGQSCSPREEAEAALGKLGIAQPFPHLSGGEKQLVVLAQALVQRAGLLLLDEPAASLDVSHQLALFELLRSFNAEGLTVICVLHDLNLALNYFDKALVLSSGEAAAWDTVDNALRPEVLEAVYGVHASLHRHAGRSYLTFTPRTWSERQGRGAKIHVICGGGTGATVLRRLVELGYQVSAGVLNALDSDEVTGRELALPMAVEAPFSPIGDEAHSQNLALVADADLVVVTDVPLGHGNERNLDAVKGALGTGVPVWVCEGLVSDDQTGAAASLRDTAARFFPDSQAMLAELEAARLGSADETR